MLSGANIKHVFVLMLENRSFDHLLGFSGITGTDAVSLEPRTIPTPTGSNRYREATYTQATPAINPMPVDPGHEFTDTVEELCGPGVKYPRGGPYPPITTKPLGPPDPDLLKPALALYLYTSTEDAEYHRLISNRVLDLLAAEPAYQYMMADATARAASLAKRNIKIGFDLSRMRATPVAVDGLSHCDLRADTQWVQLDGTMIFTYRSPTAKSDEPVAWPEASHIYIPTIVEDGVRKFDGYCPEASMSEPPVAKP